MAVSHLRGMPRSSVAGPPDGSTDEDLIGLVQSLPYGSPRRAAAYEELVRRYDFVVKSCVRRYRDSPESVEDLMQVGYLGLLKAISKFDPELGPNLTAYASRASAGNSSATSGTSGGHALLRNMTQAEIGSRLGISQMHVSRLLDAALARLRDCLTGGTAPPRKPRARRTSHPARAAPLGEPATSQS